MSGRSRRPSIARLRYLFSYANGRLYWAVDPRWSRKSVGDEIGWVSNGYRIARVDGRDYRVHQLVWTFVHGRWPTNELDHINGVRDDNRPENLRDATHSQNLRNRGRTRANTSGFKGVSWSHAARKWISTIKPEGQQHYLGVFARVEDAAAAYVAAASRLHAGFNDRTAQNLTSPTFKRN